LLLYFRRKKDMLSTQHKLAQFCGFRIFLGPVIETEII
jgi:hypothetical protein